MKRLSMVIILGILLLSFQTNAFGANWDYRVNLSTEPTYYDLKTDYFLNPNGELVTFPKWTTNTYGNFYIAYSNTDENFKFVTKFRPYWTVSDDGTNNFTTYVDDSYMDIKFHDTFFLTLGKVNLKEGVGLSYNPTDFLGNDVKMNYSKSEEERREDREGKYVLKLESLGEFVSLSYLIAPQIAEYQDEATRQLLKAYFPVGNADIELSYFDSKHPTLGLNLSGVIGENLELHSETAFCKGSDREFLTKKQEIGPPGSGVYEYEASNPDDDDQTFTHSLIGGHYTFLNKTNLMVEYYYIQDGYNQKEWTGFVDLVKDAHNNYLNPPTGFPKDLFSKNLQIANSLMTFRTLRQNYLFLRVSNPELFDYYDSQVSLLYNLDDQSYVTRLLIDYLKYQNLSFQFGVNWFSGNSDSEFGLSNRNYEVLFGVKYYL